MESEYFHTASLKRKKSGTRLCHTCQACYNNASTPEFCTNISGSNKKCNTYLGGQFVPKRKKTQIAFMITETLASVRMNEKGRNTRTFVSTGEVNKVSKLLVYFGLGSIGHQSSNQSIYSGLYKIIF
jgi:hypothetical protein